MYAVLSPPAWGRELKYNDLRFETVREHCRPPRGGGNLNNIRALAEQPAAESPPTRGRELKCVMVHRLRRLRVEVAPHAGAGIEIDTVEYYVTALLSLLGPVKRVCAMATKAGETRTVPSGPSKGQVLPVDVDTHINAILEFVCGAQVTLTCSFDVWDSELPRMELYGTKGTVLINEKDPISGPNLFGGETLMRTPEQYRWADPERRPENVNTPWPVVPNSHPFNSVSHAENPRGIGLIDMVQALHEGRTPRASGDMALHSLEVMECILKSAHEHVFCEPTTSFAQPAPLPSDTAER